MLSGQKRRLGDGVMQGVGKADVDQVDLGIVHGVAPVGQDARARRPCGQIGRIDRALLHEGRDARRAIAGSKEMRKGLEGHRMDLAHPAGRTEYRNTDRWHGLSPMIWNLPVP